MYFSATVWKYFLHIFKTLWPGQEAAIVTPSRALIDAAFNREGKGSYDITGFDC